MYQPKQFEETRPEVLCAQVHELTTQQESPMPHPWRVEDAPADYTARCSRPWWA